MKTTRYRFEKYLESAGVSESKEWLVKEFANILESDKDYTTKCDYIAMSILSLDSKIDSIDDEINELKELKSNLKITSKYFCKFIINFVFLFRFFPTYIFSFHPFCICVNGKWNYYSHC